MELFEKIAEVFQLTIFAKISVFDDVGLGSKCASESLSETSPRETELVPMKYGTLHILLESNPFMLAWNFTAVISKTPLCRYHFYFSLAQTSKHLPVRSQP